MSVQPGPVRAPDGWPSRLPLPDGTRPVADEGDGEVMRLAFQAPAGAELTSFFLGELPAVGWSIRQVASIVEAESCFEIEGEGFFGQIEISDPGPGEERPFSIQLVR